MYLFGKKMKAMKQNMEKYFYDGGGIFYAQKLTQETENVQL